ncbi:MAG: hypothetical protein AVDCRST_MAG02-2603 [uncultured Rubrobacteraceae bacterium]|uniref:HTH gntR-type domain-containing protein n=1 Tax=uncultured Rubrobacteraceae bacterium TaxID=349277 RepID=A0A6J4R2Z8_9ACTN|nr:MAG: hypothetical protein AVDCRST_MAG02-2603 [uncultured Rubrobacteraceae bacterium]
MWAWLEGRGPTDGFGQATAPVPFGRILRGSDEALARKWRSSIERVNQSLAYELVADKIRRAIFLGTFVPGDKLPPERELAKQLGVSRMTVREAVRVLGTEGYLESRRGASGGVRIVVPDESDEALRGRVRRGRKHFEDVMDFRVATEPAAVRLAALRRSEADLARLAETLEQMESSKKKPEFRRADSAFHLGIADAADNPLLRGAVEDVRAAMFIPLDALDFEVMLETSLEGHRQVLSALEASDAEGAQRAMVAHIEANRQKMRLLLSND